MSKIGKRYKRTDELNSSTRASTSPSSLVAVYDPDKKEEVAVSEAEFLSPDELNPTNDVIPVKSATPPSLKDSPLTVVRNGEEVATNIVSGVTMTIPAASLELGGLLINGSILRGTMVLKDSGRSFLTSNNVTGQIGTVPTTPFNTNENSLFGIGRTDAVAGAPFVTLPFGGTDTDTITINGTRKIIVEFREIIDAYVVQQIFRGTQGKMHYRAIDITAYDGIDTLLYTSEQGEPIDFDNATAPNFDIIYDALNPEFFIQDHILHLEFFSADGEDLTLKGEQTGVIPLTGDITTFIPYFETKFSATKPRTIFHNDEVFNVTADLKIKGSFCHAVDTTSAPVTLIANTNSVRFFDVIDAANNFAVNNCIVELLVENTRTNPNDSITSVAATTIKASAIDAGVSGAKNLVSEGVNAKVFNDGTNWKVITDAETLSFDAVTNRTGLIWFRIQGTQAVLSVGDQTQRITNISGVSVTVDTIGDTIDSVTGLKLIVDTSLEFDDKIIGTTVTLDNLGDAYLFYFSNGVWQSFKRGIPVALDILFDNTTTDLVSENVQDVIVEVYNDPLDDSKLISSASFVNQTPTGKDIPLQVEFGAAQVTDPVELAADGTITFNEAGSYGVLINLQYGRTGNPQEAAINFRSLLNGVQYGRTVTAKLESENSLIPYSVTTPITVEQGDEITYEIVRDAMGVNEGELVSFTPSTSGWSDSPSAAIIISRANLSGVYP